jgi:hypothetical protein
MSGSQQTVYIFRCSNNHRKYGATADRAGINLPAQVCPRGTWTSDSQILLGRAPQPRVSLDENELRARLSKPGFHLWEANINVTISPGDLPTARA